MGVELFLTIFGYFQRYVAPFISQLIRFFIPDERNQIPPVDSKVLLWNANEIVEKIRCGDITCVDVITAYRSRINKINSLINAVVELDSRSLEIAAQLDRSIKIEREQGVEGLNGESVLSKPMLGVPFTAKNCIGIAGLPYHVGVHERRNLRSDATANCAQNLMNAGAIFLGTTNVPELSMNWDTYNKVCGQTRNPHDLSRSPGGSSGGEGALIASAGSLIGIGSDVGGSIRIPAFANGIYGLKSSQGLVTCSQTFPPGIKCHESMLTYGPLCRYSSDLKLALKYMRDDKDDNQIDLDSKTDFKNLKIYYVNENDFIPLLPRIDSSILKAIEKAARHFEAQHGTKIEPLPKEYLNLFKDTIELWFHGMSDCDDYVPFSIEAKLRKGYLNPGIELIRSLFGKSVHTIQTILLCSLQNVLTYQSDELRQRREDINLKIRQLISDNGLIFFPTLPVTARKVYETVINSTDCQTTMAINLLGLPSLARPTGYSDETRLPIGFQIVGNHLSDSTLIDVTCELDKVFNGWLAPCKLLP